ncbi:hypothetical protein FQA39_LY10140 [Lamprigera yunnana]|nr:hypothetical protein FQA39_LY10140 [Lamprigera yunnana]
MDRKSKKGLQWKKEHFTSLFEELENHPCLYDTKNKIYANKHAREDAISKLWTAINLPDLIVEEMKLKINNV